MRPGTDTRVFAVLGDPIGHSLSPQVHNAAFRAAGIDAVYVALEPDRDSVAATMATLVRRGGGGNVTIPFKQIAAASAGTRDARVELTGSCNVFGASGVGVRLGNTDIDGIAAAVSRVAPDATAWRILGTGGSARAVVGAAHDRGASVSISSRDPVRAAAFATWAASIGVAAAPREACDVVINATPLGLLADDPLPLDPAYIAAGTAAVDLVYASGGPTRWVKACAICGLDAIDGRVVLLEQAARSWAYWFPDRQPSREIMQAALDGRLG